MKKIILDSTQCIGCGMCASIADKYFRIDETGYSTLEKEIIDENVNENGENDLVAVTNAKDACPVQVIRIEDTEEELQKAA